MSADIYIDRYEYTTPPSKNNKIDFDELMAKYKKIIMYEEEEVHDGHSSFDHYRVIRVCEEIIEDLRRIQNE